MQFVSFGGPGGMMMMGGGDGGDLACEPGKEFTDYVREYLKPFPPCSPYQCGSRLERTTLWPGRRLEYRMGRKTQVLKVVKWTEFVTGFACPYTMWKITLEKEDETQVTLSVATAAIEKGGQVVLKDAAQYGMHNVLTWLDPPTEPAQEEESEEE